MFQALAIRSEEGLKLETLALETLFGGKFTVSLSLSVCLSVCSLVCVHSSNYCLSICHSLCSFPLSIHPHLSFTLNSTFEFICWFMYLFLHL